MSMTYPSEKYCAVYDFSLLPYALGDVLTWNVQTAMRCEEAGRKTVDIYIVLDPKRPSSVYQRDLITDENCGLFFSELYGAFGTHPRLGNIHIFGNQAEATQSLAIQAQDDPVNKEVLEDYRAAQRSEDDEKELVAYFIKYIYSHNKLNAYFDETGDYPRLKQSMGCGPDVNSLFERVFPGKYVVVVHPRLRRLDAGYGGDHTYFRDSDFLEWYDFLKQTSIERPDIQFVVVGRLPEKPVAMLRLPNVMSLRTLGMGLGHELSLMLRANLFIGTSSGFAALVNFSRTPYFITRMNKESYSAYDIEEGATRLPFAEGKQVLTAEPETADMLSRLLKEGLEDQEPQPGNPVQRQDNIDASNFVSERTKWLGRNSSTNRFFTDDSYTAQETAFLVAPRLQEAVEAAQSGDMAKAQVLVTRVLTNFPEFKGKFAELEGLNTLINEPENPLKQHIDGIEVPYEFSAVPEYKPARILSVNYFPWAEFKNPLVQRMVWAAWLPARFVSAARRGTVLRGIRRLHRRIVAKFGVRS